VVTKLLACILKIESLNNYLKIPAIKSLNEEYRLLKREIKSRRSKLKSLYLKHLFIIEIIDPDIEDLKLEESIRNLFSDLGYKANRPKIKRDLDVIAKLNENIIGIEVKNSKGIEENELFQGIKYTARHRRAGIEMHPLIIWNNSKSGQRFDQYRIIDAENHKYGILTTDELLKGYLKVKEGKMTVCLFNTIIKQIGLIKFSNSTIKRMESSEVVKTGRRDSASI